MGENTPDFATNLTQRKGNEFFYIKYLDGGWGARIRTWDHGTKARCLTTWPRPNPLVQETAVVTPPTTKSVRYSIIW